MASNPPPSSRLRPTGTSALEDARGKLRDALAGLKNLDQLLPSLRVGPKALSSVIPDVHAACEHMRSAVLELLTAIGAKLEPDLRATEAMRQFIEPRISELESALASTIGRPMTAKARLALERVVARLSRDLDLARGLLDLLDEAIASAGIRIDVSELLQQTFQAKDAASIDPTRPLPTLLVLPNDHVELFVNPRVAMAIFSIAANLAASDGSSVRVTLRVRDDGECGVWITRHPARALALASPQHTTELTVSCLEAAARFAGARLDRSSDGSELAFVWPPGSCNRKRVGNA